MQLSSGDDLFSPFYVMALDPPRNLEDPQPPIGAEFFEPLIAGATKVTLTPGERRSVSVSVGSR